MTHSLSAIITLVARSGEQYWEFRSRSVRVSPLVEGLVSLGDASLCVLLSVPGGLLLVSDRNVEVLLFFSLSSLPKLLLLR